MVERPKPIGLLVVCYGLQALILLSIFVSLMFSSVPHEPSGPPGPGPGDILIFAVYIGALVGALLHLSVAYGLFRAKGWARILGIAISILGLPFLALGMLSFGVNLMTGFFLAELLGSLMYLMDGAVIALNIAAIYYLTRPAVKAYVEEKRVLKPAVERETTKAAPIEPVKLAPYMHALFQWGLVLGLLNLVMGVSDQISRICGELGIYKIDPGGLIGTFLYVLFVVYWGFWFLPFFASLGINLYGCRKKRAWSVVGLVLTLIGISAFLISYISLGSRLPD